MARSKATTALLAAAALAVAVVALWVVASPVWTLRQMKAAADADDPAALDAYVDYPSVRADLKDELRAQLIARSNRPHAGLGDVGAALGAAMVGSLVDGLVTPAGLRAALVARREEARMGAAAGPASALRVPDNPVIVRRGLSEFLVAGRQQPRAGLVFRRHGLSWKLSGVDLPPSSF